MESDEYGCLLECLQRYGELCQAWNQGDLINVKSWPSVISVLNQSSASLLCESDDQIWRQVGRMALFDISEALTVPFEALALLKAGYRDWCFENPAVLIDCLVNQSSRLPCQVDLEFTLGDLTEVTPNQLFSLEWLSSKRAKRFKGNSYRAHLVKWQRKWIMTPGPAATLLLTLLFTNSAINQMQSIKSH